jgi:hypothetical protein
MYFLYGLAPKTTTKVAATKTTSATAKAATIAAKTILIGI